MRLELAIHPITEISFGSSTQIENGSLIVDIEELRRHLLEDSRLESIDLEIVRPGDSCRVGYVFDIVEPRAKEPGSGSDFPGILGPFSVAGQGTTHVLRGAAVTVVDGGQEGGEHGYVARRGGVSKILEMSGVASTHSPYSALRHLIVVPHAFPEIERHAVLNALRVASVKAAVYLARAAIGHEPVTTEVFDLESQSVGAQEGLPRVAYIGQIHGHQHGTEVDEHILYGSNTRGMLPVPLHPNEWLDGAVVISYSWGGRGLETYFHQNHPIITELYRLHQAKELIFTGAIATTSSDAEDEMSRNSMVAAQLAKWSLRADGVILTKYAGGAPHVDMFETARQCEGMGLRTVVLASDTAPDGRAESSLLLNVAEVDSVVSHSEGTDIIWQAPAVERIIAGNPEVAAVLTDLTELTPSTVCGATNNQGASRLQPIIY
ncbi:MAG: hypothetical protein IIB15_06095 [Chloroflexi bacterium]|nr:hypothetical protein [Chloroflexota bacterium]